MVTFTASPTAAEALQLDDRGLWPGIENLGRGRYRVSLVQARAIQSEAESRGHGDGWDQPFNYVRPCRAVAKRLAKLVGTGRS